MRDLAGGLDYLRDPIANWPALTGDGQDVRRGEMLRGEKDMMTHRITLKLADRQTVPVAVCWCMKWTVFILNYFKGVLKKHLLMFKIYLS